MKGKLLGLYAVAVVLSLFVPAIASATVEPPALRVSDAAADPGTGGGLDSAAADSIRNGYLVPRETSYRKAKAAAAVALSPSFPLGWAGSAIQAPRRRMPPGPSATPALSRS